MSTQRELLLLRHAQAGAGSVSGRDYDRVLTDFGRTQPGPVGEALLEAGFKPQLVLCSASARTRETLGLLDDSGLCSGAELRFSEGLYECTTRQILMELAAVESAVERVLLLGHNPGLSDLATALSRRAVGLQPGDCAWLEFEHDWQSLGSGPVKLKTL